MTLARPEVMSAIAAGFECGHLGWCDQDLLIETRHTPETDMVEHYRAALQQGVTVFRDGLPWRHDPVARVSASPMSARVIWDLIHFDPPEDAIDHAERCARALPGHPHVLAVNEPSIWPVLCGRTRREAVTTAKAMMAVVLRHRPHARFYTCDPIHDLSEETFAATDELVATGMIGCVGVNFYPHCSCTPLAEIIRATAARYGLPIAITETGWHEGHKDNSPWIGIADRLGWLRHVQSEVRRSGAPVEFVCWYPWLDMPAWGSPGTAERWPCGWPGSGEHLREAA